MGDMQAGVGPAVQTSLGAIHRAYNTWAGAYAKGFSDGKSAGTADGSAPKGPKPFSFPGMSSSCHISKTYLAC